MIRSPHATLPCSSVSQILALALMLSMPAFAAGQDAASAPEIKRETGAPQSTGVVHTLRQIPEACARIEGVFTGNAAEPYKFSVVRTSPQCQARARFIDADKLSKAEKAAWIFNDMIRVPNAACPGQQAVVRIWRKPVDQTIELDAQGKARIYLADAKQNAAEGKLAALPMYAAAMTVEGKGKGCN